ncbi:unnamed protein product, partial [Ectocarpus sp. 12 AP-2014]
LEKDNPAQVFLMHCIQFFLATLEMDNEALLEALRPVLLFRPQATQNHRLRPRTNGPYDFYVNNMQSAGAGGTLFEIQGAPSLYREYYRQRRRQLAAARALEEQEARGGQRGGGRSDCTGGAPSSAGGPAKQGGSPPPLRDDDGDAMMDEDSEDDLIGPRAAPAVAASTAATGKKFVGDSRSSSSGSGGEAAAAAAAAVMPAGACEQGRKKPEGGVEREAASDERDDTAVRRRRNGEGARVENAAVGAEHVGRHAAASPAAAVGRGDTSGGGERLAPSVGMPTAARRPPPPTVRTRTDDCTPAVAVRQEDAGPDHRREVVTGGMSGEPEAVNTAQPATAAAPANQAPGGNDTEVTLREGDEGDQSSPAAAAAATTQEPPACMPVGVSPVRRRAARRSVGGSRVGAFVPGGSRGGAAALSAGLHCDDDSGDPDDEDDDDELDDEFEDEFEDDSEDEGYQERLTKALRESEQAEVMRTVAAVAAAAAAAVAAGPPEAATEGGGGDDGLKAAAAAAEGITGQQSREVAGRASPTKEEEGGGGGGGEGGGDDPVISADDEEEEEEDDDGDDGNLSERSWESKMMQPLLDLQKVKQLFEDCYGETCPHYLSSLNWFLCIGGVEKFEARLTAKPPPKATFVRGLVEILCMVAEVVSDATALKILNETLTNVRAYVAGVSSDDLKRSPENRAALFSAMDFISFLIDRIPTKLPIGYKRAVMKTRYGLCLEYLKGPTLQVRLSGLMELGKAIHNMHASHAHHYQQRQLIQMAHQKEIEDRAAARKKALSSPDKNADSDHSRERMANEFDDKHWVGHDLADWMINDELIELLFSAGFLHTETLKRSGDIPRYLAWLNKLSNDHLKLIWDAARESAHESIRHAVLQLLQGLFPHLVKEQLGLINSFARQLPKCEFDVRTLVLLRHLATATMKLEKERVTELGTKKAAELEVTAPTDTAAAAAASGGGGGGGGGGGEESACARSGVMSGMEVLWDCVQDDAPGDVRGVLPLALHEEAFSCLLNSVGQLGSGLPCSVDPRVWLLDEVVKCLKERKSVVQALRVLRALLESFRHFAIMVGQEFGPSRPGHAAAAAGTAPGVSHDAAGGNAAGNGRSEQEGGVPRKRKGRAGEEGVPAADDDLASAGAAPAGAAGEGESASPPASEKSSSRRARRPPTLVPTKGIVVAKAMGITGLALAELMQYKARQWALV